MKQSINGFYTKFNFFACDADKISGEVVTYNEDAVKGGIVFLSFMEWGRLDHGPGHTQLYPVLKFRVMVDVYENGSFSYKRSREEEPHFHSVKAHFISHDYHEAFSEMIMNEEM